MKSKRLRFNKDSIVTLAVIVIALIIACLPLTNKKLPGAYYPDLGYHLIRIEGIKEAILAGEFPTKVYSFALNGWGYGASIFYQDYLLYLPALLRVLGVDISAAYKIMIGVYAVLIACTTYFSTKYITNSKYAASLTTISLLLSQYYLADIYNRSGVSEYFAFIFVPILIAGIYDAVAKDCQKTWLIGLGLYGLLLTHSITFALGVVLLLGCLVLNCHIFLKEPQKILYLLKTAFITIGTTAFIYVPLAEQMFGGGNSAFTIHGHKWIN